MCEYDAMFCELSNIVFATVSQNTYRDYQTTAHARMVVYGDVAFVVDAEIYYHESWETTGHGMALPSNWLEPFKPNGVAHIYNQEDGKCPEVHVLTQRIFHNLTKNLVATLEHVLPNDIVHVIQDLDLKNTGLEYIKDPGNPDVWPFKVQHLNGFTKRPKYRVVQCHHDPSDGWMDLPDVFESEEEAFVVDAADEF
jgi:hypothetical protein